MAGAALDRETIRALITSPQGDNLPLVEGLSSMEDQLQPNGVDLCLDSLARFVSSGAMGRDNRDRKIPDTEPITFGPDGWVFLTPGSYLVSLVEVVNIPLDIMALALPRSSLVRSGVSLPTAIWDAGYSGRSQALLSVSNPEGYHLQRGARLMQMMFFRLEKPLKEGYQGRYQSEGLQREL